MTSLQSNVQALMDSLVAENKERGLQIAAYHRGELVLDAVAGHTDATCKTPVASDTLFPVFSVSKGITATVVHRLVERGLLDYDVPIAEYWPEFGANGKQAITLRQGLSHTAGIPHVPVHARLEDLVNWERTATMIADSKPAWPAGSKAEYHAITYGWIVGEPACRVTGKDFPTLLEEEIKKPLGINELYIGLPTSFSGQTAVLEEIGEEPMFEPTDSPSAIPWWSQPLYKMMNRLDMQRACIPATSGMMCAKAVAKHYAALRPGGVDGIELLNPERIRKATEPQPLPDGTFSSHALGYGLGNNNAQFGHGGHGGSESFYDAGLDLAVAFARNRLRDPSQTPTTSLLLETIRQHLS